MSSTAENMTELTMKLRLSKQASEKLAKKAAESGRDVATTISELVGQAISYPTVDEVLAPFRKEVAESGMTDPQLDDFLEDVREKAFQERQRRPA